MNGVCDQEARDLAQKALAKMEAHEQVCTERWTTSRNTQVRVEAGVGRLESAMQGVNTAISKRMGLAPASVIAFLTGALGLVIGLKL